MGERQAEGGHSGFCQKSVLVILSITSGLLAACMGSDPSVGADPEPETVPPRPLQESLMAVFKDENPNISHARLVDLEPLPRGWLRAGGARVAAPYIAIGHGVADELGDPPDFHNELFALVTIDSALTAVVEVIDIVPTPRWLDTTVWLEEVRWDSVVVAYQSTTYRDEPLRRSYPNPLGHEF